MTLASPKMSARLVGDQRGTTIIEFAVVAPVLLLIIIGGMEVGL